MNTDIDRTLTLVALINAYRNSRSEWNDCEQRVIHTLNNADDFNDADSMVRATRRWAKRRDNAWQYACNLSSKLHSMGIETADIDIHDGVRTMFRRGTTAAA